jgi:hypothetical protein
MRLKSLSLRRSDGAKTETDSKPSREDAAANSRSSRPSGRVRHDERGMAVWDLAIATGEFSTLSATSALKKLDVGELKIEETTRVGTLSLDGAGRDKGGGFDPYNQTKQRPAPPQRPPRDRQGVIDPLPGKKK